MAVRGVPALWRQLSSNSLKLTVHPSRGACAPAPRILAESIALIFRFDPTVTTPIRGRLTVGLTGRASGGDTRRQHVAPAPQHRASLVVAPSVTEWADG